MSGSGVQPENIANQALIALGHPRVLGSLRDGSREASVLLQVYAPTVEEISRSAHWNALRRQAQLTLLQDASGQTTAAQTAAGGPVTVGTGTPGMGQWLYEYAWPVDCLKARYVPQQYGVSAPVPAGNIVPPNNTSPIIGGNTLFPTAMTVPAPFLVSQDIVPNLVGAPTSWADLPDLDGAQGQALAQQTVILTNQQNASMVYTSLAPPPNVWDVLFRQAVVSLLAAKVALAVLEDKKQALAMQALVIQNAKRALESARLADGNESPGNINREASWIRARGASYGYGNDWASWDGCGILYGGWESCPFPNGSSY